MISRLPNGSTRPAITRRVWPLLHSNCRIRPLARSSTICSLMAHSAPFGFTGILHLDEWVVPADEQHAYQPRVADRLRRRTKFYWAGATLAWCKLSQSAKNADRESSLRLDRHDGFRRPERPRGDCVVGARRADLLRPRPRRERHHPVVPAAALAQGKRLHRAGH